MYTIWVLCSTNKIHSTLILYNKKKPLPGPRYAIAASLNPFIYWKPYHHERDSKHMVMRVCYMSFLSVYAYMYMYIYIVSMARTGFCKGTWSDCKLVIKSIIQKNVCAGLVGHQIKKYTFLPRLQIEMYLLCMFIYIRVERIQKII